MNWNRLLRWTSLAFLLGALGPGLLAPLLAQRVEAVRTKTPVKAVRAKTPVKVVRAKTPLQTMRATTSFPFPGRGEDLTSGEYWYRGKKIHGSGVQKLGYDLGAVRYDRAEKSWSQYKPGVDPATDREDTKNSDWLIYGQPVYAVAAGEVTGCWRNAPENPPGDLHPGRKSDPKTIPGGGNMLWVDDGAGDRVLYAHFQPGSVPKALCPHNDAFLDPSQSGQSEVPEGSRPKVKRGQFLGVVGNAGQSTNPHLHIHREKDGKSMPLAFTSFMARGVYSNKDLSSTWKRLKRQALPPGPVAVAPNYSSGLKEISRHGLRSSDYQFVFDHVAGSGYRLEWIDGFHHKGKLYFNVVFRPRAGVRWAARHNLTGSQYQAAYNAQRKKGYRLWQVDSYPSGNKVLYAGIFRKSAGPGVTAYHGVSPSDHQKKFNDLTGKGWRPKNLSVTSIGGKRYYAALYEKRSASGTQSKSFLTVQQYQAAFNDNKAKGRRLAYLNAYMHNGQPRFTAIGSSGVKGLGAASHGLTNSQYQAEWSKQRKRGLLTRLVTGYTEGGRGRYAAFWKK